jgi:hypothetical protein
MQKVIFNNAYSSQLVIRRINIIITFAHPTI